MCRPVTLAVLLFLAGCSGLAGQPTATVTPAPVPSVERPDLTFPPGTGPAGVSDPSTLANAHHGVIRGSSYTELRSRTVRSRNGRLITRTELSARFSANQSRFVLIYRAEGPGAEAFARTPVQVELWSDGNVLLQSVTVGNETTRRQLPTQSFGRRPGPFDETPGDEFGLQSLDREVYLLFLGVDVRLVRETEDGSIVYHALGDKPRQRQALENLEDVTAVQNVDLNATITPHGLVQSFHLRYDARLDSRAVHVERSAQFYDVGDTTIGRPMWYGEVLNGSND